MWPINSIVNNFYVTETLLWCMTHIWLKMKYHEIQSTKKRIFTWKISLSFRVFHKKCIFFYFLNKTNRKKCRKTLLFSSLYTLYKMLCVTANGDFATRLHTKCVCLCEFYRVVMRLPKVNIFKSEEKYITASKNATKDVVFLHRKVEWLHQGW